MSRSQNSKSTSPISVDAKELAGLMISVEDEVTSELLSSTGATLMACSPDHLRFIFRAAPVYHGVTRLIHRPNHQPRTHCYWSKQTTNTWPGMILHQNGARAPVLLDVFFNLALGRSQWYWCVPVVPRSTEWRGIFSSTTTTSARDVTTGCYLVYTPVTRDRRRDGHSTTTLPDRVVGCLFYCHGHLDSLCCSLALRSAGCGGVSLAFLIRSLRSLTIDDFTSVLGG